MLELYEQLAHVAETFGVFGYMSLFHEVVLRRWLPVGGKQYRQLEELEREKGIKFFQCVGDPPHTEAFVQGISNKRFGMI